MEPVEHELATVRRAGTVILGMKYALSVGAP
jgi:hypothetical protein